MKEFQQGLGAIVVFVGVIALSAITNGWALSILWGWFIVSAFHLPALSVGAAIGFALVVRFLTATVAADSPKRSWGETVGRSIGFAILSPLFTVGIGWIVHLFTRS